MIKKYELTTDTKMVCGRKLYRIKALIDFGNVRKGDFGGYIEKEENLSHSGNAWVGDNACVYDNARVCGNAYITGTGDYLTVGPIGSRDKTTTFYRTEDDVKVTCGCFRGALDEFAEAVKQTHGGTFYEKEYNAAIELAKVHFRLEE